MKIQSAEQSRRVVVANAVLALFAERTWVAHDRGFVVVNWRHFTGELLARRWMTRGGQSFYPVWSRKWGHGGTRCTALSQLVRWIQGKPVLPMSTWRYWAGDRVGLGRERGPEIVRLLTEGGYPLQSQCVLCGCDLLQGLDWWHLDKLSGPCCNSHNGCRQIPAKKAGAA